MPCSLSQLAYPYDAMEPYLDARTTKIHNTMHHQGYVDQLNVALEGHPVFNSMPLEELLQSLDRLPVDIRQAARNNGGGQANHSVFWSIMGPQGGGVLRGSLAGAMGATFGGFRAVSTAVRLRRIRLVWQRLGVAHDRRRRQAGD